VQLLAELYIIDGKRQRTYTDMVYTCFGYWGMVTIGIVQQFNLVLTGLAYTITSIQSIQALANSYCGSHNIDNANCFNKGWEWGIILGVVQIFLSQAPSLESLWWASILAAAMSFGYSFIAFGLTVAYGKPLKPTHQIHLAKKYISFFRFRVYPKYRTKGHL